MPRNNVTFENSKHFEKWSVENKTSAKLHNLHIEDASVFLSLFTHCLSLRKSRISKPLKDWEIIQFQILIQYNTS